MKLKDLAKKGGVESIVAIIILVGLVLLLIVFAVLPTIRQTEASADNDKTQMSNIDTTVSNAIDNGLEHFKTTPTGTDAQG